jgi:hypothetical protein
MRAVELFQVSELTASTKAGSSYSSSSESSGKSDLSMFSETEKVTEEENPLKELRGSTQGLDEIHQNAAILQQDVDETLRHLLMRYSVKAKRQQTTFRGHRTRPLH